MWIRDSSVQLGVLLPRMQQRPALRPLVEGGVRTQVWRGFGRYASSDRAMPFRRGRGFDSLQRFPVHNAANRSGLQAFFIVQDAYANGYYLKWRAPTDQNKMERMIGRGGWVATRNYELVRGRVRGGCR